MRREHEPEVVTATFLCTDIVGSTRLWQESGALMRQRLAWHDAQAHLLAAKYQGDVFKERGDGFFIAFPTALVARDMAVALQQALFQEFGTSFQIRTVLSTGEAEHRDGDYFGLVLSRAARVLELSHGAQVVLTETTARLIEEADPSCATHLKDLGAHQLRSIERAERLFQYQIPGLPSEFPVMESAALPPHNLPRTLTTFIGREKECAEVVELLGRTRLLSILGAGGSGKTRLSLKVGDELLPRYPGGVWFVDLAPVADDALLLRAVAAALRVREEAGADLLETLTAHLAPRKALLILDNCEHLVRAAAHFVQQTLVHCPDATVLVTSREALGLTGEVSWPLPGLALPPENVTQPSRLTRYEAIQLFVERATAVSPGFRLTTTNAASVARICRRLDGIPLALELAAAWRSALSPEQIDQHLYDEGFLESVDPTAPERQRTLHGTMDWSHGLLTVSEQALWRRIAVFAGSFSQEAVSAVCTDALLPAPTALRALRGLIRKSILLQDSASENRYRILETVREYGLEKLTEADELSPFRLRHLEHFAALAEEAEPHLRGPDQKTWLDRLEAEHPNLRAALTQPENGELALRLGSAVLWFWLVRGYLVEGKHYLQQLLNSCSMCPAKIRAKSFRASGILATQLHLYDEAEIYLQESYQLFKQLDIQSEIAITVSNLGINFSKKGDFKNAIESLDESLDYYKKINDENRVFLISLNIGATYLKTNLPEKSKEIFQSILPLINKIEDKNSVLILYINLGMANNLNKEYIEAFKNALKSFKISTYLKNELLISRILWVITEALYHIASNPTWVIPLLGKIDSSLAKNCEPLDNQATDLYTSFVQQLRVVTEPTTYENLFTQGANFSPLDTLEFLQNIERQVSKTIENI